MPREILTILCSSQSARPLCDVCGPQFHKRALFQHLASETALCARCAFIVHGAAAIAARLHTGGRRRTVTVDVVVDPGARV